MLLPATPPGLPYSRLACPRAPNLCCPAPSLCLATGFRIQPINAPTALPRSPLLPPQACMVPLDHDSPLPHIAMSSPANTSAGAAKAAAGVQEA